MRLQGLYNEYKEKKAKDLKVGDVTIWNYGYTETVLNVEFSKSGKTVNVTNLSNTSGTQHTRKMRSDRLVAMA